ncbi:MAG: hypothetical protein N3A69_16250, partial [Leptospiraceae bacterium]|nr:hypothetical protein [Leptospiraceae bacterium]
MTTIVLGYVLFRTSYNRFFQSFIEQKRTLALSLAREIDADLLSSFNHPDMIHEPEYDFYKEKLKLILREEPNLSSIYVLLLIKDSSLVYSFDGFINPQDGVFVGNELFGFRFYLDEYKRPILHWNGREYRNDFKISNNNTIFHVQFVQNENWAVLINKNRILEVLDPEHLTVGIPNDLLSNDEKFKEVIIQDEENNMEYSLRYYFLKTDETFLPGMPYEETQLKRTQILRSIQSCKIYTSEEPEKSAMGEFIYIVVPIIG